MYSFIEAIISRFEADAELRALCAGGISFESSENKLLNRVVFHESDDGLSLARNYAGRKESSIFVFMIYGKDLKNVKDIMSAMWRVFDAQALELQAPEVGSAGQFIQGIRHYEQETPERSETDLNRVWVGEMPYQTHINVLTTTL